LDRRDRCCPADRPPDLPGPGCRPCHPGQPAARPPPTSPSRPLRPPSEGRPPRSRGPLQSSPPPGVRRPTWTGVAHHPTAWHPQPRPEHLFETARVPRRRSRRNLQGRGEGSDRPRLRFPARSGRPSRGGQGPLHADPSAADPPRPLLTSPSRAGTIPTACPSGRTGGRQPPPPAPGSPVHLASVAAQPPPT
jgi:hypothetical protein